MGASSALDSRFAARVQLWLDGYASDIRRACPHNGRFRAPQKMWHEQVPAAPKSVRAIKEGMRT